MQDNGILNWNCQVKRTFTLRRRELGLIIPILNKLAMPVSQLLRLYMELILQKSPKELISIHNLLKGQTTQGKRNIVGRKGNIS